MDYSKGTFTLIDYVIFALMLVFSASVGVYYHFAGGRQKTSKEYFLANKNMPIIPVAFSLMASFMSAITILGLAAENYMNGSQFVIINIAYIIGTPIAAYVFLPVFYQMQATSAFEYLEKRFNKETRLLASSIFILQMVIYMSIVLYAPALTLSAVTGLSKWTSVMSIGVVCTFYCTIGGMKAVLWTDLFQSLLMFSAVFAVIAKGTIDVGGFSEVWRLADEGKRIEFFNFDPDPTKRHTVWTLAVGGIFTYVSVYAVNQAQVQRLLTVKSLKESQMALFLNWPLTSLLSLTASFAGIVVYANLAKCDPILRSEETHIEKADQILPYFVMISLTMFPGLPGLFVAGVFSASLSSVSSAINSLAAVTVEDFLYPLCFHHMSEKRVNFFTKLIALSYGILCILLTFIVDHLGGVLQAALSLINIVGGPMLGLFSLGMFFRRTNVKGSVIGFLVSLCLCFWIGISAVMRSQKIRMDHRSTEECPTNSSSSIMQFSIYNFANETFDDNATISTMDFSAKEDEYIFPLLKLSYMWYAGFGYIVCIVVGYSTSLICGKRRYVNPVLLSPFVQSKSSIKEPISEVLQLDECT
ncbi:putative sodium-dependent multivitamin transporter [Argiope bruennichi]|uniref:putative sodium-dependent multivitamin transporter n=1 Tax=Argiope bruennichi TaxID=94029 RepID=UPI0024948DD0|nr:putative sodium-dependent multivitamin transporter [Argiope bruennichi]XP_055925434.1 putative sodium-dependent multivitamin transporter [Argiope bruennichi]XP_055925435.1 putative sodium-dependent multivitamin transporter [Argiope bruennichi]XP_055925436.1 putative sodium-dependent multivitamin transporter [Argiope bruennichi]